MVTNNANRRPGDLILDRYMSNATEEEREVARENLRTYALVVVGIVRRLVLEEGERAVRARTDSTVELPERQPPYL